MRKIFNTFAYAAIAALALSSCAKEKLQPADELTGKLVTVHFGTENTDPSITKATLTPNDGEPAFKAAWENGDVLSVYYINGKYDEINGKYDEGTVPAIWNGSKFSSELPEYIGKWVYKAAYPVPDAKDNHVDFGSNRTQKGNAYNSKYDIMIGAADATNAEAGKDNEGKDIVFKMDRQTAIAYFHFTSDLDEAITSATLTVGGEGAAIASNSAHISNFVWDASEDLNSITITFPEEAPNAQDFQLWFNVLETPYASMSLTVETATKTFTISKKSEGRYEAGKLYKVKKDGISWTDKPTAPSVIFFYESFDQTSGTGGNDNTWSGNGVASATLTPDMEGWTFVKENGANKCAKFGTGSALGSATTPSLGISTSEATLWFKAGAWAGDTAKQLAITIDGKGVVSPAQITLADGAWTEYFCTITGADAATKVKISAITKNKNRFFLDEVYVYSGSKPVVLPKLESPANLQCSTHTETSLTFSWAGVANAIGYQVSKDGGSTYEATQTETSYTWTGLTAGTSYTLYVKAIGDGTSYTDSEAATAIGTTTSGGSTGGEKTFELSGTFISANSELSLTQNGITVVQKTVSGTTAVNSSYNTPSKLRIYKGQALTFSGKTIKKIEIAVNGTYFGNSLTVDSGTLTPATTSGGTIVWEGNSSSITITNVASESNVQLRTTSIKITYVD